MKELRTIDPSFVAENKCFDTFKRKWVGTALELVLTLLLAFYERQKEDAVHSFVDPNLKEIGVGSVESRSNGLIF